MVYCLKVMLCVLCLATSYVPDKKTFSFICLDLAAILKACQVMDHDDKFWPDGDLAGQVNRWRDDWREMAKAPQVWEGLQFHYLAKESVREALKFNIRYKSHLIDLANLYPDDETIKAAILENRHLWKMWNCLDDYFTCRCLASRRRGLMLLREGIGQEAFDRGEMPYFVPLHRFRWARY